MHVTIRAKDLARILSTVRPAVVSRTTLPILSSILLTAADGQLKAAACSLNTLATDHAAANVVTPGAMAFPADALDAIVRAMPGEADVTLQPSEGDARVTVSAGRTRARIAVLPADDFPNFDTEVDHWGELSAAVFRRMVVDTQFANNVGDDKWYVRGVRLAVHNAKMRATATDGHRLFRTTVDAPRGLIDMPAITFPREAQGPAAKLLDGVEGDIQLGISETRAVIITGSRTFATKLIDGDYPDFDKMIPPMGRKHTADLPRADLQAAVRRVLAVTEDKVPLVPITFARGELRLRCKGQNHDSADAVDAEVTGDEIEIGLNGKYLLDQLSAMTGATIALENNDAGGPWRLIDEGSPDIHIIMPMRV